MLSSLLSIVVAILTAYVVVLAMAYLFQSRLLFLPLREVVLDPEAIGLPFQSVQIDTDDGITLDGWYVPARDRRGVVLFFHGNAGNISHRLDSLKIFNALDLDVLIIDYRGYGRSEGRPSEQGLYRDADAAWRYLIQARGVAPEEIVVFGRSLGAAVAAYLASGKRPAALIVESGFVSVPDIAAEVYPWLPARQLSYLKFPTAEYLQEVSAPVLVIHSRDDEIIPFDQGQRLFEAAGEPKRFFELEGGHNDGFLVSGEGYVDALDMFVGDALGQ